MNQHEFPLWERSPMEKLNYELRVKLSWFHSQFPSKSSWSCDKSALGSERSLLEENQIKWENKWKSLTVAHMRKELLSILLLTGNEYSELRKKKNLTVWYACTHLPAIFIDGDLHREDGILVYRKIFRDKREIMTDLSSVVTIWMNRRRNRMAAGKAFDSIRNTSNGSSIEEWTAKVKEEDGTKVIRGKNRKGKELLSLSVPLGHLSLSLSLLLSMSQSGLDESLLL